MNPEAPQHECGVIGIYSPGHKVSQDLYYGLVALQNRGQEGSGIATFTNHGVLRLRKAVGLVNSVFRQRHINMLRGDIGIGHNRYGTTGKTSRFNTQPLAMESELGSFAFAHNGNIYNGLELRQDLEKQGITFKTSMDSEIIATMIALAPGRSYVEKIKTVAPKLKGAYSYLLMTPDSLIGGKDPYGTWPLSLASVNDKGFVLASETNAINKVGGKFIRDVENGEIIVIDHEGVANDTLGKQPEALCSFEYFYFADPASKILGARVEGARFRMGEQLYRENPVDADLVMGVPETARPAAEGFSNASGIPVRGALVRNRWLGRTFIQPDQRIRELEAGLKYEALDEVINGKRIALVDDSIVRGTTTKKTIKLLKDAGAKEVYMYSTAPQIIEVCYLGIDTAEKNELIAANSSVEKIRKYIGADRLAYLSLEGGLQAIGAELKNRLCVACFTGKYNREVPTTDRNKSILETINA